MKPYAATAAELRVLVLAPTGRDAEVTCEVLRAAGIDAVGCATLADLGRELAGGAGAIVLTSDAVDAHAAPELERLLAAQEPWSEVPVILATAPGDTRARESALGRIERAGAVTLLERPVRAATLQTVVGAALYARRRQYEIRDLLQQLRLHVSELDSERQLRERFVSLLAHDLRGPLSTATIAARLLLARPEQLDTRRDLAARIERNMLRIDRMVQDLLDANRLRAGHRLALDLQPCDLAEIAADVLAELPDGQRERVRRAAPDHLEGVWAPDQLRRALWNLVSNAFKYGAADGPVDVHLRQAAGEVIFSVHNEGPPIPRDEQVTLFEPFARAESSRSRVRGWGLGLTLVRGCAEAHGGRLELASTPEAGTTFTLRLPLDARPFQPAAEV